MFSVGDRVFQTNFCSSTGVVVAVEGFWVTVKLDINGETLRQVETRWTRRTA